MKKVIKAIIVCLLTLLLSTNICLAESLSIVNIFPAKGQTDVIPTNLMVKLTFNEAVVAEKNQNNFMLTDKDGNSYDFTVLQGEDEQKIDLMLNEELAEAQTYTVIIKEELAAVSGNTLDKDEKIEFHTENPQEKSNMTNIGLTLVVLIVGGTVVKHIKEKNEEAKKTKGYQNKKKRTQNNNKKKK